MKKCTYCKTTHKNNNTGCQNSGHRNSGNRNFGNWNTGDWNSGNENSGYWNSGDRNNGFFNTVEPNKIMVFNKWLDMTPSEFLEEYDICADIPLTKWVDIKNIENPTTEQKQMGGYLKTLDFKEACRIWWKENPAEHERFTSLPNFDWEVFTEITGIEPDISEQMIFIDGKEVSKSTIRKALKEYFN